MAEVVAGNWEEITWNHPTLGSGTLYGKAGESSELDPGGVRTDDDDAAVDGGGRNIKKMNRVKWSFSGTVSWDMNLVDELSKLKALAGAPVDADWTFTHINGAVYRGKGTIVGDLKGDASEGTIEIKIAGGGECTKIVG